MSEFLTIRLSSRADAPVQWLVWSPQQHEVIASGQLPDLSQLADIADYAMTRPVYALVPGCDVLLAEVAVPAGSSRQLANVLPFLLEEELAQDVDMLHVHLLSKGQDTAQVAVVEHNKVAGWLKALADANIEIKALVPDCLCLPLFDNGLSAAELEGHWLIRQSEMVGTTAEQEWLAAWLEALQSTQPLAIDNDADADEDEDSDKEREEGVSGELVVHCYTAAPEGMPGRWVAESPELVMQLLAQGVEGHKANLLSGCYKRQPAWRKYLKPWRKVAVAASVLLAVVVGEHAMSVSSMEAQAQAYRAESERIFRQVLPQFKRIPSQSYLKRQMNSEASRLGGAGEGQADLLSWLSQIQPALGKVPQISVLNLKYDENRGEMRFQAIGGDFQHFNQLSALLEKEFKVELGQLSREGSSVTGAVVLRRKS
ncbi:type II secretion system protein GspL [Photobacterium aquae]|uniref:type II secretion system protein GspL n=1 Tax=Photobacterium aquae TaxID=1195763 RepID=UPI000A4039D1|nr:type II secretion system protein GspL [Photobacterium aquae]